MTGAPGLFNRVSFEQGPGPGERVGDCELEVASGGKERLFELLHEQVRSGPAHALLLFDARAEAPGEPRALGHLARSVRARYGERVRTFVVTAHTDAPATPAWDGPVIEDPAGALHRRFGARSACVYLVRPDGYVAYRSQPADEEKLLAYLASVLVS